MNTKTVGFAALIVIILSAAAFSLYAARPVMSSDTVATSTTSGSEVACTREAKVCPDGTEVGRHGPTCEFDACPATPAPSGYHTGDTMTVTAHIGQTVTALGESITPTAVIDDSRCPTDVQCIWAGTVHLKATVTGGSGNSAITFELGKTSSTEVNSITLESVSPAKNSKAEISSGDYVFTFKVTRR